MVKLINPCKCGSDEFITQPNQYDIYQIIDGSLELIKTTSINDEFKLYCRECSEELIIPE